MDKKTQDDHVAAVASEIRDYLFRHPHAADSLEGIATWWLARQRYDETRDVVKEALEYLVGRGIITRQLVAGTTMYAGKHKNRDLEE